MSYRVIGKTAGAVTLIESVCMASALMVAVIYGEDISPFLYSIAIMLAFGLPLYLLNRNVHGQHSAKGGFIAVGIIWFVLSAFGALPFFFDGRFGGYINCFFESVSGFTTTGSTILADIEILPRGILWWRSFTHFIGGMGILVLANAILPKAKDKSHYLLRAEVPGPMSDKYVPRLSASSQISYCIYVAITLIQVICLLFTGIELYDAFVISFSTAGTGGFAVKNASIAGYNNIAVEYICSIFMLVFSVNFTVYFLIITKKIKQALKSEELHWFLAIVGGSVFLVTASVLGRFGFADAFRYSLFAVSSTISTTGFVTIDYNIWPMFAKIIILLIMFCGACAGSTGGGIKVSRIAIVFKTIKREILSFIHPRAVSAIRFDGKILAEKTVSGIMRFFALYLIIIFAATLLVSIDNFDFEATFSAVLTCISNVGPGFGIVGPVGNFSAFSGFSKIILSVCMLIGRLEIYPILILFAPSAWKRD